MILQALLVIAFAAEQPKIERWIFPRPSSIVYGAVSQDELLLSQTKDDKLQWFVVNLSGSGVQRLGQRYEKVAHVLDLAKMWYGAPLIDGPVGKDLTLIHKFKIGSEQLWLTSARIGILNDFTNVLCRISYSGQKVGPKTEELIADLPVHHGEAEHSTNYSMLKADGSGLGKLFAGSVPWLQFEYKAAFRQPRLDDDSNGIKNLKRRIFDYDIVPLGARRLVLLSWVNEKLSLWDYRFNIGPKDKYDNFYIEGGWQRIAEIEAPTGDQFHTAAAGEKYYLVADSGIIYSFGKTGKEWTIKTHWDDKKRPILAMLIAADGITGYVFGKDFYFKLTDKIDIKSCRDVAVRNDNDKNKELKQLTPASRIAFGGG